MLILALVYAFWFFRAAQAHENHTPALWALIGFACFFLISAGTSLLISLMISASQGEASFDFEFHSGFIAVVTLLAAAMVGNGFTALLWRFYLRPAPTPLAEAFRAMPARRTFGLPGGFPFMFAASFGAVGAMGTIFMMGIQPLFFEALQISEDPDSVLRGQIPFIAVQAVGLALILRKHDHWRAIALRWAALGPLISIVQYLLAIVGADFMPAPPLLFLAVQYASAFAVAAFIMLSVRRWGARLPVLVCSATVAKLVMELPMVLVNGMLGPDPGFALHTLCMALLRGVVLGLGLYAGLLLHDGKAEAGRG